MQRINEAILQPIVSLLMAAAVAYFLFGVMKFVKDQGSEESQVEGKKHMMWGIIGLFIMVSVWGILNFINSFVMGFSQ
ncbi:MAG: pilin [Candidatus Pacebacteria bacterium]|nr:pilin [Candidatus Paceibacterota bacterium]